MEWALFGAFLLIVCEIAFWLFIGTLAWKRWGKNDC